MRNLLLAVLMFLLVSCGTTREIQQVPVPVETVRTEYINTIKYDSIYIRDSIDRYFKGDTVVIYKYKDIYKYKVRTDTLVVRDTIQVPVETKYETIKEVNVIKGYQQFLMYLGVGALGCIVYAIIRFVRRVLGK